MLIDHMTLIKFRADEKFRQYFIRHYELITHRKLYEELYKVNIEWGISLITHMHRFDAMNMARDTFEITGVTYEGYMQVLHLAETGHRSMPYKGDYEVHGEGKIQKIRTHKKKEEVK
jgi:hypothetical protein